MLFPFSQSDFSCHFDFVESIGSLLLLLERTGLANTKVTLAFLAGRLDLPPLKIKSLEF